MHRLIGQMFSRVISDRESISFFGMNGRIAFCLLHAQDCCEHVYIESIVGDLADLENSPILVSSRETQNDPGADESGTWTFFKIATIKGYVDIRFYGESNGYYSEDADLYQADNADESHYLN